MKKNDWLILALILLISLFSMRSLFHRGFYSSHDGEHQIIRLIHFVKGLKDGQIPVRWAGPPALNGFGYPLFIFTYRLPFYLATPFYLIGFSLTDSIKAVFILTYLFSGVAMYLAQRKIWQDRLAALVGTILYLWVPWRFSAIFVRASLGSSVCYSLFPLFLWSLFSLQEKSSFKGTLIGIFSLAGLMLSHATFFFGALPFLMAMALFLIFKSQSRKALTERYLLVFIVALGLSAFYWLPAIAEKKYTVVFHVFSGYYRQHFVTLKQLLYSKWGYGLSHPGAERDEMAFQVGIPQWLTILLSSGLLIINYWRKKKIAQFSLLLIALFALSIFLMTPTSDFVWVIVSFVYQYDFPFRLLGVAILLSSLLGGDLLKKLKEDRLFKIFRFPLAFFLISLALYANRNHLRVNEYTYWPDAYYENLGASSSSYDEYRPEWVMIQYLPGRDEALTVEEGKAKINSQTIRSHQQKFQIAVQEESLFRINTIYYPGWQLFVDGKKKEMRAPYKQGLSQFSLSPGEYQVVFKFKRTGDRIVAEIISLLTLVYLGYQVKQRKQSA